MQQARQLGRYQLLDRVAFGGMAEIYRAKTGDSEGRVHLVAVKRVLAHLCEDDEFIQMLVDEAKITASLQHENIARIYEFCRTDREYFIAMEYVDGKDVRALLEKTRQNGDLLPEEHVAWIGMELARALHAAHTQRDPEGRPLRIVHRDVSPSNVLLSYRGEVKLCDFGIAKATLTRVQTKTGVIKGKVKYMSPEQAMGRKLDHRSDLFSVGTLIYEMLTLQAPFQAPTEIELIFAVRDARKRTVREFRPQVSPALEAIIDKSMARSRSQRFQSGEELAQALDAFLSQSHPGYRRSHFGRYMRGLFSREIERELRQQEEYIIEGGKADDVGENLLADVLPKDAPYTMFTAAFVEKGVLADMPTGPRGQVLSERENDSAVGESSVVEVIDPDEARTGRHRLGGVEKGAEASLWGGPPPAAVGEPADRPALNAGSLRSDLEAGWGPEAPVVREAPQAARSVELGARRPSWAPVRPQEPEPDLDEPVRDEEPGDLHAEQTRILTRAQVEMAALAARAKKSEPPKAQPQPPEQADEPTPWGPALHEANTRIFDLRSLPADMQQALQQGAKPSGARPVLPSSPPAPASLHEAQTMCLPRVEVEGTPDARRSESVVRGDAERSRSKPGTGSVELSASDLAEPSVLRPRDPSLLLDENDLETLD